MSLLDSLGSRECWLAFLQYKSSLGVKKSFCKELEEFISSEGYLQVYKKISDGGSFSLPQKKIINKIGKDKKRVVYTYPFAENITLKLLTYLMLRRYDSLFSNGLYSFRPGRNAKDAIKYLITRKGISGKYAYKADISNYFNSLPVEKLLPVLEDALEDDRRLYDLLRSLLCEKEVIYGDTVITEQKGIMAGTPLSAFFANIYLNDLDRKFEDIGAVYARYSDDIIVLADSREELDDHISLIRRCLSDKGLNVNPDKERIYAPGEGWTFLGFSYKSGIVDIAPVTVKKLKKKMKRKANALIRWADRNGLPAEKAASAFIRVFNSKLFEYMSDNELTWSLWFFPVINTDKSLKVIDRYAQDTLRYIISGRRTRSRFNVRYSLLKELGYKSLVHEYYKLKIPVKQ